MQVLMYLLLNYKKIQNENGVSGSRASETMNGLLCGTDDAPLLVTEPIIPDLLIRNLHLLGQVDRWQQQLCTVFFA